MKTIELTEEQIRELVANYEVLGDDSYAIHTALLIYELLKEQHPEYF